MRSSILSRALLALIPALILGTGATEDARSETSTRFPQTETPARFQQTETSTRFQQTETPQRARKNKKKLLPLPHQLPSGKRVRAQTDDALISWDWNREGHRIPEPLVRSIHRGLYRVSPTGTLERDLAEGETASSDAITWTFRLRSDVRWSDGTLLISQHVADGLVRAAATVSSSPPEAVQEISGFQALRSFESKGLAGISTQSDPHVIQIQLARPDPQFPLKLIDPRTFPARADLMETYSDYGFNPKHMAFLGPWQVTLSHPSLRSSLQRNPRFDTAFETPFQEVELWYLPQKKSARSLFQRNHLDLLLTSESLPANSGVRIFPRSALVMLKSQTSFAIKCPAWCRHELSLAIDRKTLEHLRGSARWLPPETLKLQGLPATFGVDFDFETAKSRSLKPLPLKSLTIGVDLNHPQRPGDPELLASIAQSVAHQIFKKLRIPTRVSFIKTKSAQTSDLMIEIHETLGASPSELLGPIELAGWQTQDELKNALETLSQKALAIPLGFAVHHLETQDYLTKVPLILTYPEMALTNKTPENPSP
ncbi:MAG: hypothetical protein RJB38_197 [Pseudomonadota bacterium]|jgi:hypothetical protein